MANLIEKKLFKFLIFSLIIFITEIVVFNLGLWQQGRAKEKQQLIVKIEEELTKNPISYYPSIKLQELQKITFMGEFDYSRTYYLENVTHKERRGRKVITPFITSYGTEILVSLGWIKDKSKITKHTQPAEITGIIRTFPKQDGLLKGPVEGIEKNSLMFFASKGIPTKDNAKRLSLWLELPESINSEVQNFSDIQPHLTPQRHQQYMFTWFTLFVILLGMYVYYVAIFWRIYFSSHKKK